MPDPFNTTEALPRRQVERDLNRRVTPGTQFVWAGQRWCCTAAKDNTLYAHPVPDR